MENAAGRRFLKRFSAVSRLFREIFWFSTPFCWYPDFYVDYCPFLGFDLWIVLNKLGLKVEFGCFMIFYNILPLVYPQEFLVFMAVEKYQSVIFKMWIGFVFIRRDNDFNHVHNCELMLINVIMRSIKFEKK